jgi:uncharacterized lipoprotein NlpE involved in copper resistance
MADSAHAAAATAAAAAPTPYAVLQTEVGRARDLSTQYAEAIKCAGNSAEMTNLHGKPCTIKEFRKMYLNDVCAVMADAGTTFRAAREGFSAADIEESRQRHRVDIQRMMAAIDTEMFEAGVFVIEGNFIYRMRKWMPVLCRP